MTAMARFSRQWPKANDGSPSYNPPTTHRRAFGISPGVATAILSFFVFFNLLLLALGITIAAAQGKPRWEGSSAGKNHYEYADSYHIIDESDVRAGIVFLWCSPPFVALALSIFNLVTRHNLTARRAAWSACVGTVLYVFAFTLWRVCAYSSPTSSVLYPVCQHDPNAKWFSDNWLNPLAIIWVLPWFALAAIIIYLTLTIISFFVLIRQHKERATQSTAVAHHKSVSLVEMGIPSKEYVEMGTRSIAEMEDDTLTLPERTMSNAPSRQLSLANRSMSPPAYTQDGDASGDSLVRVSEKDEKHGSVGYT